MPGRSSKTPRSRPSTDRQILWWERQLASAVSFLVSAALGLRPTQGPLWQLPVDRALLFRVLEAIADQDVISEIDTDSDPDI